MPLAPISFIIILDGLKRQPTLLHLMRLSATPASALLCPQAQAAQEQFLQGAEQQEDAAARLG